jgi:hypothetical protein
VEENPWQLHELHLHQQLFVQRQHIISLLIALHGKKVRNPLENLMSLPNGWENEVAQRAIWPYQMTSSWLI